MSRGLYVSLAISISTLLSCASAEAQTAPQAVGLLVFGFDDVSNQKTPVGEIKIKSSPKAMSVDHSSFGSIETQVRIEQKDGCNFHLTGRRFQSNRFYRIDLDVDFSSMRPNGPTVTTKTLNGSTYRFFVTDGVKVCNRGENRPYLEFLPPTGQCATELETPQNPLRLSSDSTEFLIRKISNAEAYLRANFCRGSAF